MIKRILCSLLVISVLLLVSCKVKPIESTEEQLRAVGTVGEREVRYEELRFMVMTCKKSLDEVYGEGGLSDEEYEAKLWEYVNETLTYNCAVLNMCEEVGIYADNVRLTNAVQQKAEELAATLGGFSKYKKYLKQNYLTDSVFRHITCVDLMQSELFYVYVDDFGLIESDVDAIYDVIKEKFVRTQHIYISKATRGAKELIEEAYEKLSDGEDFWQIALEYSEDSELTEAGEYVIKGYMNEKYEEAAFSLARGEYSEVIEDVNGYFIVKRLEQDTIYVMTNLETLTDRYQHYTFLEMIYEVQRELEFVPNDYLMGMRLSDIE